MKKVIRNETGYEPVILDPEKEALLESEMNKTYFIHSGGSASIRIPDENSTVPIYQSAGLEINGNRYLLKTGDAELELIYDDRTNLFHRYLQVDDPGASPYSLDLVYYSVPVFDAWKMKTVVNIEPGTDPVILDPAFEGSLYHENYYDYYFNTDGSALASIPGIIEDKGHWTLDENELVLFYDDGSEMRFEWDSQANILHRYWTGSDPDAAYHFLDFVYLYR